MNQHQITKEVRYGDDCSIDEDQYSTIQNCAVSDDRPKVDKTEALVNKIEAPQPKAAKVEIEVKPSVKFEIKSDVKSETKSILKVKPTLP